MLIAVHLLIVGKKFSQGAFLARGLKWEILEGAGVDAVVSSYVICIKEIFLWEVHEACLKTMTAYGLGVSRKKIGQSLVCPFVETMNG